MGLIAPGFGRLWLAALLLPVVCFAAAGWWTWNNVVAAARAEMARTVDMVHEQVLRSLETQDAVLAAMGAFVAGMSWDRMRLDPAAHEFAHRIDLASPTVETLGVVDPTGHLAVASETATPPPHLALADRDYVRAWPPGRLAAGAFISPVVISRLDGSVQVHVSRPRIGPDGRSDGGVIVSSFSPTYFEAFFRDVAETPHTGFTLLRDDGCLLADFPRPVSRESETLPPGDLALAALRGQMPVWSAARAARQVHFVSAGSLLTGIHLIAIRRVSAYRLWIVHRLDPQVLTGNWLRQMLWPAIGAVTAMALLLLLTARAQSTTVHERLDLRRRTEAAEAGQALAQERAELEARLRQTEKVAALGQLAAGVAHDFNNLLQTIVLNAEMLQRAAPAGAPAQRGAGLIITASERGMVLTRRMLAHTRRDADPAGGPGAAVFLVPAALRTVRDLLGLSLGVQYRLRLDIAPELPAARGSAAEFESVLINLVVNARDAMRAGGEIVIAVAATRHHPARGATLQPAHAPPADLDWPPARPGQAAPVHPSPRAIHAEAAAPPPDLPPGRYVRVQVTDTGIGMDAATRWRAGEAFFTTKPPGHGTGLGLSMARGFARRNGGGLTLASVAGQGTTVSLWLPVA